jgi:GNAT superfamily N-acetyltransferase
VYVERRGGRGYFGMLAVDPARQSTGLGRKLIDAAEQYVRDGGATAMDIRVVNLRTELPRFYRRLGYVETGTEPVSDPRALQPFHFIVMSKPL